MAFPSPTHPSALTKAARMPNKGVLPKRRVPSTNRTVSLSSLYLNLIWSVWGASSLFCGLYEKKHALCLLLVSGRACFRISACAFCFSSIFVRSAPSRAKHPSQPRHGAQRVGGNPYLKSPAEGAVSCVMRVPWCCWAYRGNTQGRKKTRHFRGVPPKKTHPNLGSMKYTTTAYMGGYSKNLTVCGSAGNLHLSAGSRLLQTGSKVPLSYVTYGRSASLPATCCVVRQLSNCAPPSQDCL